MVAQQAALGVASVGRTKQQRVMGLQEKSKLNNAVNARAKMEECNALRMRLQPRYWQAVEATSNYFVYHKQMDFYAHEWRVPLKIRGILQRKDCALHSV